jgi:hypothetical protein
MGLNILNSQSSTFFAERARGLGKKKKKQKQKQKTETETETEDLRFHRCRFPTLWIEFHDETFGLA